MHLLNVLYKLRPRLSDSDWVAPFQDYGERAEEDGSMEVGASGQLPPIALKFFAAIGDPTLRGSNSSPDSATEGSP